MIYSTNTHYYNPNTTLINVTRVGVFQLIDVLDDGNCFFNALCCSPHFKDTNPISLTCMLVHFLIKNEESKSIYINVLKGERTFGDYINYIAKNGNWADTACALFVCMMCDDNIVTVCNYEKAIGLNNFKEWESVNFIEDTTPIIYLYYHQCGLPFVKTTNPNHFGYLIKCEGLGNLNGIENIMYNGTSFKIYHNDAISFEKEVINIEEANDSKLRVNINNLRQVSIINYFKHFSQPLERKIPVIEPKRKIGKEERRKSRETMVQK